jgi:hypothetical protein
MTKQNHCKCIHENNTTFNLMFAEKKYRSCDKYLCKLKPQTFPSQKREILFRVTTIYPQDEKFLFHDKNTTMANKWYLPDKQTSRQGSGNVPKDKNNKIIFERISVLRDQFLVPGQTNVILRLPPHNQNKMKLTVHCFWS